MLNEQSHYIRYLEQSYMCSYTCCRERQDQLERAWWEEKAELSAGPAEQGEGGRFSNLKQEPESGHTSWQVRGIHLLCLIRAESAAEPWH